MLFRWMATHSCLCKSVMLYGMMPPEIFFHCEHCHLHTTRSTEWCTYIFQIQASKWQASGGMLWLTQFKIPAYWIILVLITIVICWNWRFGVDYKRQWGAHLHSLWTGVIIYKHRCRFQRWLSPINPQVACLF